MDDNIRTLKYRGIDDWNRPIFKVMEKNYYVGCIEKLYPHDVNPKEVIEYFKNNTGFLRYFGIKFNCEPEGGSLKSDLVIVFDEGI